MLHLPLRLLCLLFTLARLLASPPPDGLTTILDSCTPEQQWTLAPGFCCRTPPSVRRKNAYITLLGGVDNSFKYRGYLYNVAILGRILRSRGSTADVVVLVIPAPPSAQLKNVHREKPACSTPVAFRQPGTGNPPLERLPPEDEALLQRNGVKVRYVEPMFGATVAFDSMVFAKTLVWQHTEYRAVQFLDADVMPFRNMDAFFGLPRFTAGAGMVSPMNAGWFRLAPSCDDYKRMRDLVVQANGWGKAVEASRPTRMWDPRYGWGAAGDPPLQWKNLRGQVHDGWKFHHASFEQGLYFYYFLREKGAMDQLLYKERITFMGNTTHVEPIPRPRTVPFREINGQGGFPCLRAPLEASYFHFTGQSKPWVSPDLHMGHQEEWWRVFSELGTGLHRDTIPPGCFASPLGYFAPAPKTTEKKRPDAESVRAEIENRVKNAVAQWQRNSDAGAQRPQ